MSGATPMLQARSWLVVGDVLNASKPAHAIVQHLTRHHRTVYPVNPRIQDSDLMRLREQRREARNKEGGGAEEGGGQEMEVSNGLHGLDGQQVEVLDLCIAPAVGLAVLQQAAAAGIKRVFIQPGAESRDILEFCRKEGIEAHQGCVLREMQ
jgi:predicted CoA-binding protein